MEKVDLTLFSFCPLSLYIVMFAVFAGHILYKDINFFFINIENNRETRASLTLIIIENFILNFQKLKRPFKIRFAVLN